MKKSWLFLFSSFIAFSIAIYSQRSAYNYANKTNPAWKTFVRNSKLEIMGHKATGLELEVARIPSPRRSIASDDESANQLQQEKIIKDNHFLLRENRVLIGDIHKANYQDDATELEMLNKFNPTWKESLGHDLLRFQNEETKVMIKEEFSIIQIQNGKGKYAEQVIVTYVLKNGSISSYRALIDSETGSIIDTWDKTIHENYRSKRANLSLPSDQTSGIKAR